MLILVTMGTQIISILYCAKDFMVTLVNVEYYGFELIYLISQK